MTIETVVDITRQTFYIIVLCSAPMLLISLIIGLTVSVFQTVTSIQEQTLTFLPKLIVILLMVALLGGFIFSNLSEYTVALFSRIPDFAK